jgi:phosphoribosylamine--glycine ligase
VVLPLLRSDLAALLQAAARGDLSAAGPIDNDESRAAVCVVMASGGYPGSYATGKPIAGLEAFAGTGTVLPFHAGTAMADDRLVTAGGRVLAMTAVDEDLPGAVAAAYRAVDGVSFDGAYCRRDIGYRALARLEQAARG